MWPKVNQADSRVVIRYCYRNKQSWDKLSTWMQDAEKRWEDALGSKAGVQFEEESDQRDDAHNWCENDDGSWNKILPSGILVLDYVPGEAGNWLPGAGYDRCAADKPFCNALEIDPKEYDEVEDDERAIEDALTHELGMFGLPINFQASTYTAN